MSGYKDVGQLIIFFLPSLSPFLPSFLPPSMSFEFIPFSHTRTELLALETEQLSQDALVSHHFQSYPFSLSGISG